MPPPSGTFDSRTPATYASNVGWMPSASALAIRRGVLGVVDGLGLVDEHDRDVVTDGVPALQARVVQGRLRLEVEERSLVLRASEDLEELRVERHGSGLPPGAPPPVANDGETNVDRRRGVSLPRRGQREHFGSVTSTRFVVRGLEVEAQERLRVARAQVEPPVAEVDREPVEPILLGVRVGRGDLVDPERQGPSTRELISPEAA